MRLITIFIFIVIIIIIFNCCKNKEGYDSVIAEITLAECADKCKITEGCHGIAYNKADNTCYLSEQGLYDLEYNTSRYSNEYDPSHLICNKIDTLQSIENPITRDVLINNASYNCQTFDQRSDEPNKPTNLYLSQSDTEFKKLDNLDALYRLDTTPKYNIRRFDWDSEAYHDSKYVDKQLVYKSLLDTDHNKVLRATSILSDKKQDYEQEKELVHTDYEKYDDFNIGDYLIKGQCMTNTDLTSCMMKCNSRADCIGFEHNSEYTTVDKSYEVPELVFSNATDKRFPDLRYYNEIRNDKNLCCLKKNLGPFVSRTNQYDKFKNGNFFLKNIYLPLPEDFFDDFYQD